MMINRKMIVVVYLALINGQGHAGVPSLQQSGESKQTESAVTSTKGRLDALIREHNAGFSAFMRAARAAKTNKERDQAERLSPNTVEFARRFIALAVEGPEESTAPEALFRAFQCVGHSGFVIDGTEADYENRRRDLALAGEILDRLRPYASNPRMANYCRQIGWSSLPQAEVLLGMILSKNLDRTARGCACSSLADTLSSLAKLAMELAASPEKAAIVEKQWGKGLINRLRGADPAVMEREIETLHKRVLAEFADVKMFPEEPRDDRTLGRRSQEWLEAHLQLALGKPAPEIEGTDVDGKAFKLSDYRGKVVALVFWASWCGPCMTQIPHERELVRKLEGRPFALLGVNCDYKQGDARAVLAAEKITWPNWYDGDPGTGKIAGCYHVQGIPAVFVLDAEGIIREKDVRGEALDKVVEVLLKEQEGKAGQ